MKLVEIPHFDQPAYILKTHTWSDQSLRDHETKKLRQHYSNPARSGLGFGAAVLDPSFISTGAGSYYARATNVSEKKLKIIHDELRRRGLAPREDTSEDRLAVVVGVGTVFVVGQGVEFEMGAEYVVPPSEQGLQGAKEVMVGAGQIGGAVAERVVGERVIGAMPAPVSCTVCGRGINQRTERFWCKFCPVLLNFEWGRSGTDAV